MDFDYETMSKIEEMELESISSCAGWAEADACDCDCDCDKDV